MKVKSARSLDIPGVIRWGGLPVPYVAAWSSETSLRIARDPLIENRWALFRGGRRGEGKPIFGQMDETRMRHVVCKRLCQVCTRPFGDQAYVIDHIYGTYNGAPLINEPATCRRCFEYSVQRCPGIARMAGQPKTIVARVRRYNTIAVEVGPAEGPDADLNLNELLLSWKKERPISYVRPALVDYDVLPFPAIVESAS